MSEIAMQSSRKLFAKKERAEEHLMNIWGNNLPIYRLFSTQKYHYLYDTGTNNIFSCDDIVHTFLNRINEIGVRNALDYCVSLFSIERTLSSIETLKENIEKYNILKYFYTKDFGLFISFDKLIHRINHGLRMIQLEITDQCNLRCGYCVYDEKNIIKRNHGKKNMTKETAYKAVRYLFEHSHDLERVAISFYGGEPLINFGLIQEIVKYSNELFGARVHFSMTTNATLINNEMAKFLTVNGFNILISLDGPKDCHDLWRKDAKGRGSYDRTVNGLILLEKENNRDFMKLGMNMVYAPPYSENKVEKIASFIENNDRIPRRILMSYPSMLTPQKQKKVRSVEKQELDFSLNNWVKKRFLEDYSRNAKPHPLAASLIEPKLARYLQRPIFDEPNQSAYLNGCCIPGGRKAFVTLEGKIHVCERIGQAPDIGDIFTGVNIDTIKRYYYEDYANKSIPFCRKCWLVKLCDLCYRSAFSNNELDMDMKNLYCLMKSMSLEDDLKYYCELLETDSNGLDYLYDFKFQ